MLGFAMRAGKLVIGTELICNEIRHKGKKVKLVLISSEASDGTKKKITGKCSFYGVEQREIAINTEELGRLLGKAFAPAAVAVCDDGFAREIIKATDAVSSEGDASAVNVGESPVTSESDEATNRKEASNTGSR